MLYNQIAPVHPHPIFRIPASSHVTWADIIDATWKHKKILKGNKWGLKVESYNIQSKFLVFYQLSNKKCSYKQKPGPLGKGPAPRSCHEDQRLADGADL